MKKIWTSKVVVGPSTFKDGMFPVRPEWKWEAQVVITSLVYALAMMEEK